MEGWKEILMDSPVSNLAPIESLNAHQLYTILMENQHWVMSLEISLEEKNRMFARILKLGASDYILGNLRHFRWISQTQRAESFSRLLEIGNKTHIQQALREFGWLNFEQKNQGFDRLLELTSNSRDAYFLLEENVAWLPQIYIQRSCELTHRLCWRGTKKAQEIIEIMFSGRWAVISEDSRHHSGQRAVFSRLMNNSHHIPVLINRIWEVLDVQEQNGPFGSKILMGALLQVDGRNLDEDEKVVKVLLLRDTSDPQETYAIRVSPDAKTILGAMALLSGLNPKYFKGFALEDGRNGEVNSTQRKRVFGRSLTNIARCFRQ